MHAFGKITLFFCAGAIMVATGKKYISQMEGLGKKMPVTFAAFFVGSLGVIGLPPSGGFYSKWFLILGTLEPGRWIFMVVLLVSSFLNAFYFLPIVFKGFFPKNAEAAGPSGNTITEAPLCCVIPLTITAGVSLVLFFIPDLFINLIKTALGM
jgi:multicomponent Na+:H+ antiporter subunit D